MKYGHEYAEALASSQFPTEWISAAVSYRNLKKCIKKVQRELEQYGLDADTLKTIDSSFGVDKSSDGSSDGQNGSNRKTFTPELWVAVDEQTGEFLHAGLSDNTKQYLHRRQSVLSLGQTLDGLTFESEPSSTKEPPPSTDIDVSATSKAIWKLIPLTTVTTFFNSLDPALVGVETVQEKEVGRLTTNIVKLGGEVAAVTNAASSARSRVVKNSQKDMRVWREVFKLYLETPIFFSTYELDHGCRSYSQAKGQLHSFSDRLVQTGLVKKFRNPACMNAFNAFIALNLDILRIMHFEEMNSLAVRKILKKFDKRTSLTASKTYRLHDDSNAGGILAKSVAKDMCAELQSNVLVVVPQLDDYLCPICFSLAWKPIKLGCCNAIYCIRCIITLQRGPDVRCPMCRSETVATADASRIDKQTLRRLETCFPREVKYKQIANERSVGVELYGEQFYKWRSSTCSVM